MRIRRAFTLVELLVVIGIISVLIGILLPSLSAARKRANEVKCLANIRSQLQAIYIYSNDNKGELVCGSENPLRYPGQGPLQPICSNATFQFWLGLNQEVSGLGALVEDGSLVGASLFCPSDTEADITAECTKLKNHTSEIAWCSYLYRQLDGQAQQKRPKRFLANLGNNAQGMPIRALIMDMQATMEWDGLPTKRNHDGTVCCIGFVDGSAMAFPNKDDIFTFNGTTGLYEQRLNAILEAADATYP